MVRTRVHYFNMENKINLEVITKDTIFVETNLTTWSIELLHADGEKVILFIDNGGNEYIHYINQSKYEETTKGIIRLGVENFDGSCETFCGNFYKKII